LCQCVRVESILAGRDAKRYYGDGGGLWLVVGSRAENGKPQAASWVYRFMLYGKSREAGIGSARDVGFADAREAARIYRQKVKTDKVDILEEKRAKERERREAAQLVAARRMTFRECAEKLIAKEEPGWRNDKHRRQWRATLEQYAYPILGDLSAAEIDTPLVVKVIEPIWLTKTETASRLRGRIESVLDWAKVAGYRSGDNPARWQGHLEHLLARKSKVAPVEHHAALPYRDIGAFATELRQQGGTAARALEFLILNWSRTGEVLGTRWEEFSTPGMWIIPSERMKSGREHRIALSKRAMQILAEMKKLRDHRPSPYVFQGAKDGQPLSDMSMLMLLRRMGHPELTVHGFRSCAMDWAASQTGFPQELRDLALAHVVSDKTLAAYQRTDMFEKRRRLAEAWAKFIDAPAAENGSDKVVAIGAELAVS